MNWGGCRGIQELAGEQVPSGEVIKPLAGHWRTYTFPNARGKRLQRDFKMVQETWVLGAPVAGAVLHRTTA